mmetsp:Transcript_26146/g.41223  ORF Transcript_26146/g.41223 Transcript_26146/m.41223 type:complete len:203 (+) Transcript_26146:3-611(+)
MRGRLRTIYIRARRKRITMNNSTRHQRRTIKIRARRRASTTTNIIRRKRTKIKINLRTIRSTTPMAASRKVTRITTSISKTNLTIKMTRPLCQTAAAITKTVLMLNNIINNTSPTTNNNKGIIPTIPQLRSSINTSMGNMGSRSNNTMNRHPQAHRHARRQILPRRRTGTFNTRHRTMARWWAGETQMIQGSSQQSITTSMW